MSTKNTQRSNSSRTHGCGEKKKAVIKELEETVSSEMFLRSTVTGWAFSTAARDACDARANATRQKIAVVKAGMAWQEEMLNKYQ